MNSPGQKNLDSQRKNIKNRESVDERRRAYLKSFGAKSYLSILFLVISVFLLSPNIKGEDHANLWGQIVSEDQRPLSGVQINLEKKATHFKKTFVSDSSGLFRVWGLPLGTYTILFQGTGYQTHLRQNILLEPSQTLYLKVVLFPLEKKGKSYSKELSLDYTNCYYQTILNKKQIRESPSAHNVWSLVENQDLSATTNRIDVGGLWSTIPALYSSRGSCSWTQNIYLLNGMDVTDPYWTGLPLFFPDFYTLGFTQLINAGLTPEVYSPGGYFDLLTQEGTPQYHGEMSLFFIHKKLQSSNISSALEKEGTTDSHRFNHSLDGNFTLSGPLIPDKLFFFTSFSGLHLSRDLADYENEDKASLYSGFLSLKRIFSKSSLRLIWTGQVVTNPSFGAGRNIPFASTLNRKDIYNIFQVIWDSQFRENHFFKVGLCFNHGQIRSDFQEGLHSQHGLEIFRNIPSGTAAFGGKDRRDSFNLLMRGDSFITNLFKTSHRFQYGFQLRYCSSFSQRQIADNVRLHFFESKPLEIIKYNSPVEHRETALHFNFFAQDTVIFSNFFSVIFGFHLAYNRGWAPHSSPSLNKGKNEINWLNLSPRLGLVFPLSKDKTSALKISAARYYFTLPLYYLTYGNPNSLGGWVYSWSDNNNDRQYQEGETHILLRREGPLFSKIDPELKRPYTDELSISFHRVFGSSWFLTLGAFFRENRDLIETVNTGVPFSSYEAAEIFDIGDDRIPDTGDDLTFIVYNQKIETLGQDFFLLTNYDSEKRKSRYYGLDLTLVKKYGRRFTFFLSLTATSATGTTNPGNTEWENDDGIVGSLYDNPNTLINARGRMRFDRAYTGRIGFNFLAPLGIRIGCIIKYYDGQPFTRKIIVQGMNQGPFYIQAHPQGEARYEYNRTVDIRIEKILNLKKARIRIILDGFNILNRGLATEENEWTGPEFPLRFATEIQSPRVFRLGLTYEF